MRSVAPRTHAPKAVALIAASDHVWCRVHRYQLGQDNTQVGRSSPARMISTATTTPEIVRARARRADTRRFVRVIGTPSLPQSAAVRIRGIEELRHSQFNLEVV